MLPSDQGWQSIALLQWESGGRDPEFLKLMFVQMQLYRMWKTAKTIISYFHMYIFSLVIAMLAAQDVVMTTQEVYM